MKALGKGSIASIVRVGLVIAWWALWVAAGFLVLAAVGYGVALTLVANGSMDPAILQGGGGNVDLSGGSGGNVHLTYDQPGGGTWPVMVPTLLIYGVGIAGSLIIVWRLRRLFDSFSSGEPFRRENATHLRVIWITMVVIEVGRYLLKASTAGLVMAFGRSQGVGVQNVELSVDVATWGSILILIVLAEVFREGARLKEEQELTI